MKISALYRVVVNSMKICWLKIKYRGRVNIDGIQFWDPSATFLVGKGKVQLHRSIMIEKDCYFSVSSGGELSIGEKTFFNRFCYIASREKICIGHNCNFGPNVSIYDHDHLYDSDGVNKNEYKTSPIVIGNNCWIGDGAKILRGTTIGDGCVIGAGTVIKGVVPSHSMVVGHNKLHIRSI